MESTEDIETAGKRGDELTILGRHAFAQTVFGRALQGGGACDEVADITHRLFLP
ncbi:hypothetical protein D3C83_284500 [compost metagenome]